MEILHMCLFLLGLLAGIIGICLLSLFLRKRFPRKDFDERQKLAQGEAFKVSFLVTQLYLIVIQALDASDLLEGCSLQKILLLGLVVGLLTYETYCMFTDASLPIGEAPGKSGLVCAGLSLLWILSLIVDLRRRSAYPALFAGSEMPWMQLLMAVAFGYSAIAYFVQLRKEWKE